MKRKFGKRKKGFGLRRKFGKEYSYTICVGNRMRDTKSPHRRCDSGGKGACIRSSLPLKKFIMNVIEVYEAV
jgi:hypothetical protein